MRSEKTIIIKISVITVLIISLCYYFLYSCYMSGILLLNIRILRILVLIIYFITLFLSYKIKKSNYIVMLFLITLFIFQYGRINFLWILGDYKEQMNWFVYDLFTDETKIFVNKLLFFNILGTFIGVLYCVIKKEEKIEEKIEGKKQIRYIRNTIIICICLLPIFLIREYSILKKLYQISYADIYKIGIPSLNSNNFFLNYIGTIYQCTVFLIFALVPKKNNHKIIMSVLYIITIFIFSLRGARSNLFSGIFMLIWYYHYFYEKKIKIIAVSSIFIFLIIISNIVESYRNNNFNNNQNIFIEKIENFIYSQGITGTLLSIPQTHPEIFVGEKVPYIISSFTGEKIVSQGLEYNKVEKSKNIHLAQKMSYKLNKSLYISGAGVGGNYILEMFDFGKNIGIFFLSALFIIAIQYYSESIKKSNKIWMKAFLISQVSSIFMVPRENYIFLSNIKYIIIYIVVFFIIKTNQGYRK